MPCPFLILKFFLIFLMKRLIKGAADIIKIAMIKIHKRLRDERLKSKMILQVHDELLFEVPAEELEQIKGLVIEEMEGVVPLSVPLKVDTGTGKNWREAG